MPVIRKGELQVKIYCCAAVTNDVQILMGHVYRGVFLVLLHTHRWVSCDCASGVFAYKPSSLNVLVSFMCMIAYLRKAPLKRTWLVISEVSVHGQLVILQKIFFEGENHSREGMME